MKRSTRYYTSLDNPKIPGNRLIVRVAQYQSGGKKLSDAYANARNKNKEK